jgi:hypothetical protein
VIAGCVIVVVVVVIAGCVVLVVVFAVVFADFVAGGIVVVFVGGLFGCSIATALGHGIVNATFPAHDTCSFRGSASASGTCSSSSTCTGSTCSSVGFHGLAQKQLFHVHVWKVAKGRKGRQFQFFNLLPIIGITIVLKKKRV